MSRELMNVLGEIGRVVAGIRQGGIANAAQVDRDDRELLSQARQHFTELVPILRKSVDQDDGGARTAANVVHRGAVDLHCAGGEARAKTRDQSLGGSWRRLSPRRAQRGENGDGERSA